jgi:hypothetical protein
MTSPVRFESFEWIKCLTGSAAETDKQFGMYGTDLGYYAVSQIKLHAHKAEPRTFYFYFGDTRIAPGNFGDFPKCVGIGHALHAEDLVLTFDRQIAKGPHLKGAIPDYLPEFVPLSAPDTHLGNFQTPSGVFRGHDGAIYMFFTTSETTYNSTDTCELLASVGTSHLEFEKKLIVSTSKFVHTNACVVEGEKVPGLPYHGPVVLMFGTPGLRGSPLYLAAAPLEHITDKSTYLYHRVVLDIHHTHPSPWTNSEQAATAIVASDVGDHCVIYDRYLDKWLLFQIRQGFPDEDQYGTIGFRYADNPVGPWSEVVPIFKGWGVYAPIVISEFTQGQSGSASLSLLVSIGAQYNVALARIQLSLSADPSAPASGAAPGCVIS